MRKMTLLWQDGDRVRNTNTDQLATVRLELGSSPVLALDQGEGVVSGRQEILQSMGWKKV